jgi:hypothetical protein
MSLRGRLNRVVRRLGADERPLTVVLVEASAERLPGRCERTNSAGLPVVEITFDPAGGAVPIPPPPYKLVCGTDPVDLV